MKSRTRFVKLLLSLEKNGTNSDRGLLGIDRFPPLKYHASGWVLYVITQFHFIVSFLVTVLMRFKLFLKNFRGKHYHSCTKSRIAESHNLQASEFLK